MVAAAAPFISANLSRRARVALLGGSFRVAGHSSRIGGCAGRSMDAKTVGRRGYSLATYED
jgi:hypothetical protein